MQVLFVDLSIDNIQDNPVGGRVGSLKRITEYLSKYMDVDVFYNGYTTYVDHVFYFNELYKYEYDVIVFNRGIGNGLPDVKAKNRILWVHDLPHSGFIPNPKTAAALTVVNMSKYGDFVWRKFYRHIKKSIIIPNGVDEYFNCRKSQGRLFMHRHH